jgi:hypothetical protein
MKNILSRLFANIGKQIQKEHSSSCKEYNSGTHLIDRCLGCGDKYRTFETMKQTNLLKMNWSHSFEVCQYPLCLKANVCLDLGSSFKPLKNYFRVRQFLKHAANYVESFYYKPNMFLWDAMINKSQGYFKLETVSRALTPTTVVR